MTGGKKDKGEPHAEDEAIEPGDTPDAVEATRASEAVEPVDEAIPETPEMEAEAEATLDEVDPWPAPEDAPAAADPPAEPIADDVWPAPDSDAAATSDEPADEPAPGEPRTVFMPVAEPGDAPADAAPAPGEPRTVFMPPRETTVPPPQVTTPPPTAPAPVEGFIAGDRTFFPRRDSGGIQVGDVLNHIFEVTRFIARGGMGEVFEGANVSSGERVAIKVMLPSLAADANVQAMFKREARTLTRLGHPALVQYRVMAQEPQLGVLYIVTEYIDGTNLSDVLGELKPTTAQIRDLGKRLADGLRVAHALDAIHRDISPDNVLLEGGKLERAKIIDFGIAKDLDPTNKTIVGDGFAGKLNYVAPEQLGDFGREVGPWSDVFSLGLVLLAVARGRDPDMGATLVDAVDRRREGPDLSTVPEELRSVLAQMLVADPKQRLRSMDAVIAAFDGAPAPKPAPAPKAPTAPRPLAGAMTSGRNKMLAIGGGAALLLIVVIATAVMMFGGSKKPGTSAKTTGTKTIASTAPSGPADATARAAVAAALPGIACSWLVPSVAATNGGEVEVTASGVARDPGSAQGAIAKALADNGVPSSSMNFDSVVPINAGLCTVVDALRPFQSDQNRLVAARSVFEMSVQNSTAYNGPPVTDSTGQTFLPGHEYPAAKAVLTLDPGPENSNMAYLGFEDGFFQVLATSRAKFMEMTTRQPDWSESNGKWRIVNRSFPAGLKGNLLLTSPKPISEKDLEVFNKPKNGVYDAAWAQQLSDIARRNQWKAEIIWYRVADDIPG